MSLNVIFKWLNNDSTADLNQRFAVTFKKGITTGANLVPSGLNVAVTAFTAMTDEGLLVENTETYVFESLPLNQTTVLTVYARWIQADEPIIEYRAYEVNAFNALTDQGDHIVFGVVTLGVGDVTITSSNITYDIRDVFDRLGRSPFRGYLATSAELPPQNNRDSDFYIVGGAGGLVEIFAWNGTTWLNLTNTLALQNEVTSHRNNLYVDEKHLTDSQKDAAIGSFGAPSITNRYITQQDTARLLESNEKSALAGSHGTPSGTNPFVTVQYPLAEPQLLTLAGGGRIELTGLLNPVYVGKGAVGTANTYFALLDLNRDRGYINSSSGRWPRILEIFKDSAQTQALNPAVDADADGFYGGNLYITTDQPIDTSLRVSYSAKKNLGTIDKGFDSRKSPASDFVSGEAIQHIQNIKGKPFETFLEADESNRVLRDDVDNLISYLGSNQNTTIVASNEDYDYFDADIKLGPIFVKNIDVPIRYTFENTFTYTYSPTTGVVTYTGAPNLTTLVSVGNIFIDGLGVEYRVTARTTNTITIVNIDTGLRPARINDNILPGGSTRVNNNPRNLLMSELKAHAHEVIRIEDLYRLKEFSRPEGRPAFGISQGGKRIDPRVILYGSCVRRASSDTGEIEVAFTSSVGDIQVTDFISELYLWCKVTPQAPNLAISINNEQVISTISVSQSGTASPDISYISGERFQRIKIIDGLDSLQVTTVNMRIASASTDPLVIAGIEILTVPPKTASISFDSEAVSGTFRITYNSNSTSNIAYNATLQQIQTQVKALSGLSNAYVQLNNNFTAKVKVATTTSINVNSMPASIDGTTLSIGDRVLVKNQVDTKTNSIYVFNGTSQAATRISLNENARIFVQFGTINGNTYWNLNTDGVSSKESIYGGDIVIFYNNNSTLPITITNNLLLNSDGASVVSTVLNDVTNADIKLLVESGIGFENTRINSKTTRRVQPAFPSSNSVGANYTTILDRDLVSGDPIINIIDTPRSNIDFDPNYTEVSYVSTNTNRFSPLTSDDTGKYLSSFKVGDVVELIGSTANHIVRITSYANPYALFSPNLTGSTETKKLRLICSLGDDAPDDLGEEFAARYEIITSFVDYSTTDFSVKNSNPKPKRYAVHKDGQTIVSANEASISIDKRSVVVPASTGKFSIGVCGPRLDLEFNNDTAVTLRVSIDGSDPYDISVAAGVTRKTIFNRARHTFHEVHITSLQAFQVTHMTIYSLERGENRTQPMLSTQDNVSPYIQELVKPAVSSKRYRYSHGKVFYDALKYSVFTKGAGSDTSWTVVQDQNEFLGRYVETQNAGDRISHIFFGTGIEIAYFRRADGGQATVQIDGVNVNSIAGAVGVGQTLASGTILDTYGASDTGMRLVSITGLRSGSHIITITQNNPRTKALASSGYKVGIFGFFELSVDGKLRNTFDVAKGYFTPVSDVREFASSYADLIGDSAFPIEIAERISSAYALLDATGTPINCTISVFGGKTRISLAFNYVIGANPGLLFGELFVVIDGKVIPRYIEGTTQQSYFKEISSSLIELDDDYSTSPYDIFIVRINGPTDLNIPINNPWLGQKFTATIAAGGTFSTTIDPVIADPEYMVVDVKFLDTDGKLYPATAVSFYSVDAGARVFAITNDFTGSLTFYVTLKG
jgi:hypothetical protein